MVGETKSFLGVSYFKETGQNESRRNFSTKPKRSNFSNLHKWLVPTQGRKPRQTGGVDKENNSQISRSVENAPNDHTQVSIELLATQDHESEGIEQMRPLRSSVDNRRKVHHGRRPSYSTFCHTQHTCETLSVIHTLTPPVMTRTPDRVSSTPILQIHLNQWGEESSHNLDRSRGRVSRDI